MKDFYFVLITLILCGCSSDEPVSPEEQPSVSDNVYLEFNKWVYSQMNSQYLWREDMPDSLDCDYDLTPKEFFMSLLSDKDRFSYFTNNPSYKGPETKDLGFAYQEVSDSKGNKALYVLYVTSPSARDAGLKRGDMVEIISLSADLITLGRLDARDLSVTDDCQKIVYSVNDNRGQKSTVLLDSVYEIGSNNIGYLCYLEFADPDDLQRPLKKFADNKISDLILDLRYNPGGYVSTCRFLCNCIVPQSGYGRIFQECSYNDILAKYYLMTSGSERTYSYFDVPVSTDKDVLGQTITPLQLDRLYVLTSRYTASASEATVVCLRPYMEVITIGEQTVGKGVGSWNIADPRYQYSLQPITMRYYNADNETTPDTGLVPDLFVPDGYSTNIRAIGDINEPLLAAALSLIASPAAYTLGTPESRSSNIENSLTPVGEPSYVTEYKNKHYNESN